MQFTTAYIALGANLGDRESNIRGAIAKLREVPSVTVSKISTFFENPAVGGPADSPAFLNAVAKIETTLDPHALLARLFEIERSLGRDRRTKWEPRPIDLDLILYGNQIIRSADLTIPHPLMHERDFVLRPLAEIAPDVMHPVLHASIRDLCDRLGSPR